MQKAIGRFEFLFGSTKGLVLVGIGLVSLVTVVFGMLSGPMADLGIRDIVSRLLGMQLDDAAREGRIIMLYHSIAMAVIAIETYFITSMVRMKKEEQTRINATITVGYIVSLVFGLAFAYWGGNFIFHGLFIFGQSLVFFAGILLAAALWPWRKEHLVKDRAYAHTRGGLDLERTAFFTMAVCTLGSALFGAIPASMFGNGYELFLAENVVREPEKTGLQLAIIGHLHIMLTLIGVALMLLLSRWIDFKGKLHKWAMPLTVAGTIVISLGVWLLVPFEAMAHNIIYAGSGLVLPAGLFLVIFAWRKIIRERLAELNAKNAGFWQKVSALIHDPLKFGVFFQIVYMNFVVTFVGLFMAARLDKVIRMWPAREERILLTGHWHILASLIATIILLFYANSIGLKGRFRQWFGWLVIIGSDLAFTAMTLFETKRLYVTESGQQGLVDWAMAGADLGLFTVLVVLGVLLVWRLIDLFRKNGWWRRDAAEEPGEAKQ